MLRSIYLLLLKHSYIAHLKKTNVLQRRRDEQLIDESVFERYREYLAKKNTIKEVWTSIIYTVDVVLDWIFVEELYQQWQQEESDLQYLFIPSFVFAILGTILYLLDAFDVFQWLNLCSSGNAWRVTFCNFMLEDLPQMVITGIAVVYKRRDKGEEDIFTSTIIINLFTSSFALITKCVAIQESRENQEEEYTFPNLHRFVKKNPKLAGILVKEDIQISPGQLERLINNIRKGRGCQTMEIVVKANMPGGVIALVQSFENIKQTCFDKKKPEEIIVRFEDGSKMSTLEVSHLVVKMIELKDVTWNLDLRECSIGTSTAKKQFRLFDEIDVGKISRKSRRQGIRKDFLTKMFRRVEAKIVYEGNTIFGLQLLLRQTGLLLRRTEIKLENETMESKLTKKSHDMSEHKIQVFRKDAIDVQLENIVLDEFVIKGLCHVLKFATNVSTLTIINDYNNGTTQEEAGNQFGIIKEEILRFDTKHITRFDYSYDNNRKVQWAYAEDGKRTKMQQQEKDNERQIYREKKRGLIMKSNGSGRNNYSN